MIQASEQEKSLKKSILIIAAFAAFLSSFLFSAIVLALPAMGEEFNANAIEMGWILNSFSLSSGVFLLVFGRLGDIAGRKRIFSFGILFLTLSTFFIVFSPNILIVIILRIIQGLSNAMIFGTIMAIVSAAFKPGERGRAVGLNLTSTYLGLSLGPLLGGFLILYLGWRSIFIFIVPFNIVTLILIKLKIKIEWADSSGERFDLKGSIIYCFALFGFMYGFSILPSLIGWICLAMGLLFGFIFMLIELKTENPIFEFKLIFKNRMFAFSSLSSIIIYASIGTISFYTSLYLQYLKNLDAMTTGLIMISQPLGTAILSTLAGKLSDNGNPGIIASIGMGTVSIGLFLFYFINENTNIAYLIALLGLIGLGFGLFSSPNTNAIMSSVEKKYLGIASGTLGTMRTIGQMLSMGIAMMLFSLYIGREIITPSIYPALLIAIRTSFLIFAILCTLGIFVSLSRNKNFFKLFRLN